MAAQGLHQLQQAFGSGHDKKRRRGETSMLP
jgi:hypothetical protein